MDFSISKQWSSQPLPDWNPSIKLMDCISECNDKRFIYITVEPDQDTSKVDVCFFASESETGSIVRVLVQLTLAPSTTQKMIDSFNSMMSNVKPIDGLKDYRLFVAPKSKSSSLIPELEFFNLSF